VSVARTIRNLALIGFMGTGKTAVGRAVAHQLDFRFVDTDEMIQARAKKTVSRIFAEEGEAAFREWEGRVLEDLATADRSVIATGGGLGAQTSNLVSLKKHALVVCLWAGPEAIWERVRHQNHRPLLQTADPQARIRELLTQRAAAYREADILINTDRRSVREVAQQVLFQFAEARRMVQ
jgi:shikimate kinase